jgi:hypothetical protein
MGFGLYLSQFKMDVDDNKYEGKFNKILQYRN